MGPIDTTDKYDLIWSDQDNKYIAFPRNHTEGMFIKAIPHTLLMSHLAGCNAIGLPTIKSIVDTEIQKASDRYDDYIKNLPNISYDDFIKTLPDKSHDSFLNPDS